MLEITIICKGEPASGKTQTAKQMERVYRAAPFDCSVEVWTKIPSESFYIRELQLRKIGDEVITNHDEFISETVPNA